MVGIKQFRSATLLLVAHSALVLGAVDTKPTWLTEENSVSVRAKCTITSGLFADGKIAFFPDFYSISYYPEESEIPSWYSLSAPYSVGRIVVRTADGKLYNIAKKALWFRVFGPSWTVYATTFEEHAFGTIININTVSGKGEFNQVNSPSMDIEQCVFDELRDKPFKELKRNEFFQIFNENKLGG